MFKAKVIILYGWIYDTYRSTIYDNSVLKSEGIKRKYTVTGFSYFTLNNSVFVINWSLLL